MRRIKWFRWSKYYAHYAAKQLANIYNMLSTNKAFIVDPEVSKVIARDDRGFYVTNESIVGTCCMDPYRHELYKRESTIQALEAAKIVFKGTESEEILNLSQEEWDNLIAERLQLQ